MSCQQAMLFLHWNHGSFRLLYNIISTARFFPCCTLSLQIQRETGNLTVVQNIKKCQTPEKVLIFVWDSAWENQKTQFAILHNANIIVRLEWWDGSSIGRALDSWFDDPRFEPRQEYKKLVSFSKSYMLCWLTVRVPNPHVYTHT